MPQQKPVDDWQDVDDWEDTSTPAPSPTTQFQVPSGVEQPGMLSRAWHALSDPLTDAPSRFARSIGDYITTPSLSTAPTGEGGVGDYLRERYAMLKGFGAGALEGIGDLASGFTSPINLATTVATGGASTAAKAGLPQVARGLSLGAKALSAPVVLHGAGEMFSPDSTMAQRGQGLIEMAGGGAAMMHTPTAKPKTNIVEPPEALGTTSTKAGPEVKPPISTAPEASTGPKKAVSGASEVAPGIVDKYQQYREVPVGTRYTVKPEAMSRRKMADAIKLGFEYQGLTDDGRIIIKKIKDSPDVKLPDNPVAEASALSEAANLPRTIMASMDVSAPLRQGLGLIHKKEFWNNLPSMMKALGSEDFYRNAMDGITADPLFQKTVGADGNIKPSFAEKAGLQLTDLNNMTSREESMLSKYAEKIPGIRASNRAYTLFLNKTRADVFKSMVTDASAWLGQDAKNNLSLARDLAEVVNTSTGRGNLGRFENSAKNLSTVLFSPRLMASRLQMMNPQYYIRLNPVARREALKSLAAVASAAGSFTALMKMAGAQVESDPGSSDFGKVKFGNTRIDPYGGFQQYIVLAQRLMPQLDLSPIGLGQIGGEMKSTTTGREYSLDDSGFGRSTRADVLSRFVRSKTNPIINFGWGLLSGAKELSGKPMQLGINPEQGVAGNVFENSIAQRFLPMLFQDIYDLVKDEETPVPAKGLAAFLASLGMGSQTYGNDR